MQINSFCKPGRESDREKTKGTPFQSHLVPLCSSLVCLEQLGFVLGRAVTPKTRQEMGENSSCEPANVDFGGIFRNTP